MKLKLNEGFPHHSLTWLIEAWNSVLLERKSSVRVFTLEETTKSQDTPMRQKSNKHGGHFYSSYISIIFLIFQYPLHLCAIRTTYLHMTTNSSTLKALIIYPGKSVLLTVFFPPFFQTEEETSFCGHCRHSKECSSVQFWV